MDQLMWKIQNSKFDIRSIFNRIKKNISLAKPIQLSMYCKWKIKNCHCNKIIDLATYG
jgi:hypothetical protein